MPGMNDEDDKDLADSLPQPVYYEIRLKGQLDPAWSDWFDCLTITLAESDETTLFGPFVDQSALFGLIAYLRNKDLALISIKRVVPGETGK